MRRGPAGVQAPLPGEPSLGGKGELGVHARLITGPIWRVPTAKQTPVFKEVDFRQQIISATGHCNSFHMLTILHY